MLGKREHGHGRDGFSAFDSLHSHGSDHRNSHGSTRSHRHALRQSKRRSQFCLSDSGILLTDLACNLPTLLSFGSGQVHLLVEKWCSAGTVR